MMSAMLCLLATAAASILTSESPKSPPSFEKLGNFVGRGGDNSGMIAPGPGGSQRFYVCYTYITDLDLVSYDLSTGAHKVWRSAEGGAWAMELGDDNRLYLGTYGSERVTAAGNAARGGG